MAESPKRPADVSRADVSREVKPASPAGPTNETARAADSVPVAVGPFTTLPTQFGRYRIDKLLGKGAMGAVYLAHDIQLDRSVALKVARVSTTGSAKLIQRMETEAKAAAKIDHPQICKVYDFGEIDGIRFIALQYIEGEDLKSYLKRVGRKREPAEAINLILQMARALGAAHAKDVIHRDLKPENIMLNKKGEPVIMDFGLARRMSGANNAGLTQGMILGTAAYMSPEQAIGIAEGIDQRSDLYALGVMLFEMLTGEWPFTGTAIQVMGRKSVSDAPSPLTLNPNIPPQLAAVCHRMIAQKKEDRYANCAEFVAALDAIDLNAPASVGASVAEGQSTIALPEEPSFDFLQGDPVAPLSSRGAASKGKTNKSKKSPGGKLSASVLAPLITWWRDQPPVFRWTLLGCAGVCSVLLATVLFFRKGDALVKVEIHAPDVEVTFQKETLTLADGAQHFKVAPGEKTLHIKSGDVEFDTDKFTLNRGTNPAVTVELVKSEIVTKLGEKEISRKSLTVSTTNQTANAQGPTGSDKSGWQGWPSDAPPPAIAPFDAGQSKKHQEAWAAYLKVPVEYTNSIGMKFRLIPPGEFTIGRPAAEIKQALLDAKEDEKQNHISETQYHVLLTQPVYMGINEVTQADFETLMGKNPSFFAPTGSGKNAVIGLNTGRFPVEMVSWDDATEFCVKLNLRENLKPIRVGERFVRPDGVGYCLPSEAEWEFACRSGTTSSFWVGEKQEELAQAAWFSANSSGRTHAVGELKPNPFGLFDVHGNVWEYVQNGWDPKYHDRFRDNPAIDPMVPPSTSSQRVLCGGNWYHSASICRASASIFPVPTLRNQTYGFRVSLAVSAVKAAIAANWTAPTSNLSGWQGWPSDSPPPAIAPFDAEQAMKHQEAWAAYLKIPVNHTNSIGMKFRLIPPGEFVMGSTPEELQQEVKSLEARGQGGWAAVTRSSAPQHKVVVTQPIYLGVHEVTQDQYAKLNGTNPSFFSATGAGKNSVAGLNTGHHPVEMVSWLDSTEACRWLSLQENLKPFDFRNRESLALTEGTGYRLPTEAEWEFACRAGTTTTFWSGDRREDWESVAWFGPNSAGHTHAVGELKPNPFGLFDVHGNVAECVADGWQPDYYSGFLKTPAIDPIAPFTNGSRRVNRGGAWGFGLATGGSSSNRRVFDPSFVDHGVGFRMAIPVSGVKAATTTFAPSTGPGIPADAVRFQKKAFKLFTEQLTWQEAKKKCQAMGGRLAEVRSKEENDFITQMGIQRIVEGVWLGATDELQEGRWLWSDGSELTYKNWSRVGNQPNNKGAGEHYLMMMMIKTAPGEWCDQPAAAVESVAAYICEWDASSSSQATDQPAPAQPAAGVVTRAGPLTKGEIAKPSGNETVSFVKDIVPEMVGTCGRCHNDSQKRGGLSMMTFETLMKGGKSGRVIVPSSLSKSRLWRLVNGDETPVMPAGNEVGITRKFYNNLKTWIEEGAKFDGGDVKTPLKQFVPTIKKLK